MWGASNVGKTTIADKIAGGNEFVYRVRFPESGDILRFEGYDPDHHRVVLLDEFEGEIKLEVWKKLCDKWPIRVRNFGGDEEIRPTCIVFTSNMPITEWWNGRYADSQVRMESINRRITAYTKIMSFADADQFMRDYRRLHPAPEPEAPESAGPTAGGPIELDDLSDIVINPEEWDFDL